VVAAVRDHRAHLEATDGLARRRKARLAGELRSILVAQLLQRVERVERGDAFARAHEAVAAREVDPWTAADDLIADL
jgi:LAO/AO transport system kinase